MIAIAATLALFGVALPSHADASYSPQSLPLAARAPTVETVTDTLASGNGTAATTPGAAPNRPTEALLPNVWIDAPLVVSMATEGAWSRGGGPAALQMLAMSLEPELAPAVRAHVELLAKWGHDGVPFPSSQGLSSFDAGDFSGLGEAWVTWAGSDRLRVKAGWVDANSEFAVSEAAGEFANPSFGLSPALALLPSYPDPAPSLNVFARPLAGGPEVGGGVYRAAEGAWSATAQLTGGVPGASSVRWSAGCAVPLNPAPAGPDPDAAAWLYLGRPVPEAVSPFVMVAATSGGLRHVGAGLTTPTSLPLETWAGVGASLVAEHGKPDEVVAEVFLSTRPLPWLLVQPDLQLRITEGERVAPAALIRVVLER